VLAPPVVRTYHQDASKQAGGAGEGHDGTTVGSYSSTITLPDKPIGGLNLKIVIKHEHMGDLKVSMTHAGMTGLLKDTNADDSSDHLCVTHNLGVYSELWAQLGDMLQGGNWTLKVEDTAVPAGGELTSWSIFWEGKEGDGCEIFPMMCEDLKACTDDYCDMKSGQCVHLPNCPEGTECKDNGQCE
jgi:subtilisin-like proprotein convertase family protein